MEKEIGTDFLNISEQDSSAIVTNNHVTPDEEQVGNSKFGKKIKPQSEYESEASSSSGSSMSSLEE